MIIIESLCLAIQRNRTLCHYLVVSRYVSNEFESNKVDILFESSRCSFPLCWLRDRNDYVTPTAIRHRRNLTYGLCGGKH